MLRRIFLELSHNRPLRHWMEHSPLSQRLTSRFVAGKRLQDGIQALKQLWVDKITGTLDFLGENVQSLSEGTRSRDCYLVALDEIERAALPATVSIKLTQFGLDFSEDGCLENVMTLASRAQEMKSRVEIDMESSEYTDRTLRIVHHIQDRLPGCVRAVIQAYLYRSEEDIDRLSAARIPIRLCKGAYRESPEVAFPKKSDVDANYLRLVKLLLDRGTYPAIASHDENMIREAMRYSTEQNISKDRFEFQMLYGIRRDLQRQIVQKGYRLRLYVPYGDAWYPYFMRRLAERPANVLFLAKNLLRN
ncbi:MAG TPA: proline dehydrogenase family protein [Chthoniobacterales bacterium]|nr:proline dehydrogenase family protein [Chthoniobacterales bacterium]